MRALFEDTADILSVKILALVLGLAFIAIGLFGAPLQQEVTPLIFLALGCYITAASLVGLRDGPDGWSAFAPAGFASIASIAGLAVAAGLTV